MRLHRLRFANEPSPGAAEICDDNTNSECRNAPACQGGGAAEVCDDGIDNDGDNMVDCADKKDCGKDAACSAGGGDPGGGGDPEVCDDGIDNDGDGKTDCSDKKDCRTDPACQNPAQKIL
jgi:hypothetical protein